MVLPWLYSGMVQNLKRFSLGEMKEFMVDLGLETYRAEQIYKWIWQRGAREFAEMTDADQALLERMSGKTQTGGGAADPAAIGHHGHTELFKDVLQAIETGGTPSVDGHEGRRSVEIILGIYAAAETGNSVALPLASDPVLAAREASK